MSGKKRQTRIEVDVVRSRYHGWYLVGEGHVKQGMEQSEPGLWCRRLGLTQKRLGKIGALGRTRAYTEVLR